MTNSAKPAPQQATFVGQFTPTPEFFVGAASRIVQNAETLKRDLVHGRPVTEEQAQLLLIDWQGLVDLRKQRDADPTRCPLWNFLGAVNAWRAAAASALELAGIDSRVLDTNPAEVRSALLRLQTLSRLRPPAATPAAPTARRAGKGRRRAAEPGLTPVQLAAVQAVNESEGNIAAAARRLGRHRATVQQAYTAGMAKLGRLAPVLRKKTGAMPSDHRGGELVAGPDDGPAAPLGRRRIARDRR